MVGRPWGKDPERRREQAERMKKKNPMDDPANRKKVSDALRGKGHSTDRSYKEGATWRGKQLSPEHRKKVSEGMRESWRKRKQEGGK